MVTFVDKSCAGYYSPFGKIKFKNGTFTPRSKKQEEWMLKIGRFEVLKGVLCPHCGKRVKSAGALNLHIFQKHKPEKKEEEDDGTGKDEGTEGSPKDK